MLTESDIDALLTRYRNVGASPDYLLVSPKMMRCLWRLDRLRALYQAHPLPRRTLRKCQLRRVYVARRQGRQRIRREARQISRYEAACMTVDTPL